MQKKKPNLFIVGAAKSGTTSLHYYLSQHPDIYMSTVKEPHFFSKTKKRIASFKAKPKKGKEYHTLKVEDEKIYYSLFEPGYNKLYRGEASPSYLYDNESAKKIYDFNADARIIIILREPVNRAFSHYKMVYNLGIESETDFLKALKKDQNNLEKIWGGANLYIELGQYFHQLENYFKYFPAHQIFIMKFEDLIVDPIVNTKRILEFLDLDFKKIPEFKPEVKNQTQERRSSAVNQILRIIRSNKILNKFRLLAPSPIKQIAVKVISIKGENKTKHLTELTSEALEYLNGFYNKDKSLLKKHFDIFWE